MKNIRILVRNAVIAKNLNKCINSKSLGCFVMVGVLGFTTLVPAQVAMAETNYTEKVVYDITSSAPKFSSLEDMKSKSIKITPEDNPDYFLVSPYDGTYVVKVESLPLDGKVRYYESKNPNKDAFNVMGYVILKVKEVTSSGIPGYKVDVGLTGEDIFGGIYLDTSINIDLHEFNSGNPAIDSVKSNLEKIGLSVPKQEQPKTEQPKQEPPKVEEPKQEQPNLPSEDDTPTSFRLGGSDRYETAMKIAKEALNGGKMKSVILASGLDFPDSLSASGLSAKYDAPILLSKKTAVASSKVIDFITQNMDKSGQVIIVGGEGVIDGSVVTTLKQKGFSNIKRLGGKDRYATNAAIVKDLNPSKGGAVFLASSSSYADALSVSSVSAKDKSAIVLSKANISSETKNLVDSLAPKTVYIIGGTGVISPQTEAYLKTKYNVVRLGGKDRYETSKLVYNKFKTNDMTSVALASSNDFPDSLAGSFLAYKRNSMILLVNKNNYKMYKDSLGNNVKKFYALGGSSVVPDAIVNYYLK